MGQAVIEHSESVSREALPVNNGKLAMWLFLSTEVMFFAALLGSYLVLRWSTPGGEWPDQHAVHVQPWLGVVNTLILIASSVAMARAAGWLRSGSAGRCWVWMLAAFFLGLSFLGIKAMEYNQKYRLGLLPSGQASRLHDRADVYYLAQLKAVLTGAAGGAINRDSTSRDSTLPPRADSPPANHGSPDGAASDGGSLGGGSLGGARTATLFGGVNWTEQQLGMSDDPVRQQELLNQLAQAVYPLAGLAERERSVLAELEESRVRLAALQSQQADWTKQLDGAQETIAAAQSRPGEANAADLSVSTAGLEQARSEAAVLTGRLSGARAEESSVAARVEFLELLAGLPEDVGLDESLGLNLPKVIPQGRTWANTYFLLTGCHALHLIAGLLVIGGLLCVVPRKRQLGWVENTSLYWQFVDVVWLVLFPLIYLL